MTCWLEGRAAVSTMTGYAITGTSVIVRPAAANEGCGGMTQAAIQRGDNVGGVGLGILANRDTTIMTGNTIVDDAGMIEHRADEAARGMTDTAILIGINMTECFVSGENTIMTRLAVIHDAGVGKRRGQKTRGLVTLDAITVGWHMVVGLSWGGITIVAGPTVINDTGMIELGTGKGRGVMAHRAILQRGIIYRNMTHRHAGRRNTIVARSTVIDDIGMIEYRWCKGTACHVTDTAILGCYNVAADLVNFTGCIGTIVARLAGYTCS